MVITSHIMYNDVRLAAGLQCYINSKEGKWK